MMFLKKNYLHANTNNTPQHPLSPLFLNGSTSTESHSILIVVEREWQMFFGQGKFDNAFSLASKLILKGDVS